MSMIHEPDRAFSVVIPAEEIERMEAIVKECCPLDNSRNYLFIPENPSRPFELVRGLGIESAEWTRDKLALVNLKGIVCRWDQVDDNVMRAPTRIPGYVGNHFSFVVTGNRVFEGEPPSTHQEPDATWEDQSFANHNHPDFDVEQEETYVSDLKDDLALLFPERQFVVEHEPGDRVTFYEPDRDAPTESSVEWKSQIGNPVRFDGVKLRELVDHLNSRLRVKDSTLPTCYECGGVKIVDRMESLEHPGVVFAYCETCGKRYIAATRTMRYRVGAL